RVALRPQRRRAGEGERTARARRAALHRARLSVPTDLALQLLGRGVRREPALRYPGDAVPVPDHPARLGLLRAVTGWGLRRLRPAPGARAAPSSGARGKLLLTTVPGALGSGCASGLA